MINNHNPHELASSVYVDNLELSWKKSQGIFYTDFSLSRRIIESLSLDSEDLIIDPCCGTGHFLKAAEDLGYRKLFGCDTDSDAILICKEFVNFGKFLVFDSIFSPGTELCKKFKTEKFDAVVGNPPYARIRPHQKKELDKDFIKESGNNLFSAALNRATELVKPGGVISYIIPKNFLHVSLYSSLRRKLLSNYSIISIVDIGPYFKNVRGEQVIFTFQNTPPLANMITYSKLISGEIVELTKINQSFYHDEIIIFENIEDFWIYKKLNESENTLKMLCSGYIGRGRSKQVAAIAGKDLRKFGFRNTEQQKEGKKIFLQNIYSSESGIIGAFAGDLEASETVTVISDDNKQTAMSLLAILNSRLVNYYLYKFCYNNSKFTMHTDPEYIMKIPLPRNGLLNQRKLVSLVEQIERAEYLTVDWLKIYEEMNDFVNEIYEIQPNEIKRVDQEIRKIQSKKWFLNV